MDDQRMEMSTSWDGRKGNSGEGNKLEGSALYRAIIERERRGGGV